MAPLFDVLTLPLRAYEAAVPFALWLMAEGWTHEDATLAICTPMILLGAKCPFVARDKGAGPTQL